MFPICSTIVLSGRRKPSDPIHAFGERTGVRVGPTG
jgi:hypothetical protein